MNTATTLSAFWQEVYADAPIQAYPDIAYIQKNVKFGQKEQSEGGEFIQPVILTREHGWTYAQSNTGPVTGIGPKAATADKAKLLGSQLFGQGSLDYEAAARASKGKASFVDSTELLHKNLVESGAFRQEIQFLYGGEGLGTVEAGTTAVTTFKVPVAEWSPFTWGGMIGGSVSILSANGATLRGTATIVDVDLDPDSANYRTITLSAAQTLTAGDIVYPESGAIAGKVNESLGLRGIMKATTTLFGMNLANRPYFRSSSFNVGGALDVTKILKGALRGVHKGLREDSELWMSPAAFQGLMGPLVDPTIANAARKVDATYSPTKIEIGSDKILLHAQGFKIAAMVHPLVRNGDAFLVQPKRMKRVGSQEMSFETPNVGGEIFVHSPTTFSYEVRCYSNQALFVEHPGKFVRFSGITVSET